MKLVLPDRLPTSCFPPILFNRFFPRGAVADDLKRKLRVFVGNKHNTLFWVFAGEVLQQ